MSDSGEPINFAVQAKVVRATDLEPLWGGAFLPPQDWGSLREVVNKDVECARQVLADTYDAFAGLDSYSTYAVDKLSNARSKFDALLTSVSDLEKKVQNLDSEKRGEAVRNKGTHYTTTAFYICEQANAAAVEPLLRRNALVEAEKEVYHELRVQLAELHQRGTVVLGDADKALTVAQQVATQVGLNAQARAFDAARQKYASDANTWLVTSAFLAVVLVGACCYALSAGLPPNPDAAWSTVGGLAYLGSRACLLSVLSFLAVASVRNYRAARHNEVVNGYRADTVATLEAMRQSGNGQVAEVLVVLAGEAVFSPKNSGYGGSEPLVSNHVAELLKAAGEPKTKEA